MPNEAVVLRKADAGREVINEVGSCKANEIFRSR